MRKIELARGLRPRGNVIHGPVWRNGKRVRESYGIEIGETIESWNRAAVAANERLALHKSGKRLDIAVERERIAAGLPKMMTFTEYAAVYVKHHESKWSRATETIQLIDKWITPYFAETRIDAITSKMVADFQAEVTSNLLARGRTQTTVNHYVRRIKFMMRYAADTLELIDKNPARALKFPKCEPAPNAEARLTHEEAERVIDGFDKPEYRTMFAMAYMTLQRVSTCGAVRWRNVKADRIEFLRGKNKKSISIDLEPSLAAYIDELRPVGPVDPDAYVFQAIRRDRVNWYQHVRKELKAACKRAGILYGRNEGGISWHKATRASGASRLQALGYDLHTIMVMGNWSSIAAMLRYLKADGGKLKSAAGDMALRGRPRLAQRSRRGLALVGQAVSQ